AMVYRVIFGVNLTEQGLSFDPLVPEWLKGPFVLTNFKYRDAVLSIRVLGTGNKIKSLKFDGQRQRLPFIFSSMEKGHHTIEIELDGYRESAGKFRLIWAGETLDWTPPEPTMSRHSGQLVWNSQPGSRYLLWDGKSENAVSSPHRIDTTRFGIYCLYTMDPDGFVSDSGSPIVVSPDLTIYEAENGIYQAGCFSSTDRGYSGRGYVRESAQRPSGLKFNVQIPNGKRGRYALQVRGANGRGRHGTYAAIRSVFIDGNDAGTFILEATGDWQQWVKSNYVIVELGEGSHTIQILLNPENRGWDNNMSFNKEN